MPLRGGKIAVVDDTDYPYLSQFKWYCDRKGYVVRTVYSLDGKRRQRTIRMHRAVLGSLRGR